ncbi:uncharacterized protein LOC144358053, partial [Saccoglossus kowalevskii]
SDPCQNFPCLNGGTCTALPGSCTIYSCQCVGCYTGLTCATLQDACANSFCQNGATCVPVPGSCTDWSCACAECYTGMYCTQQINACQNSQCQNGGFCVPVAGSCTDYTCTCTGCYTGQYCTTCKSISINVTVIKIFWEKLISLPPSFPHNPLSPSHTPPSPDIYPHI